MSTAIVMPSTTPAKRGKVGQERTNWPATILLLFASLTVLVPLYVTVSMAFKTTQQAVDGNAFTLPNPFSTSGFAEAWSLTNFPQAFFVSTVVTLVTVTGAILVSAMASYAIVRNWERRFFRYSFFYLLAAMFIPFPVVALPQVRLTGILGLDNFGGVIILHIVFSLAFNTLLFTTFLRSIPLELEESMRMDGASTWQTFWKLIFPLLSPMAATVGIFAFLRSWNDFMMPSLIISNAEWQTIPVVNSIFQTQFSNSYNVSFASYLMAMAPAILVYVLAQRWVMSGLTQGAIK
ncbi:carbohydrate ABC transporter membrane protein 2, CUT1 family (TC 3.A.1.1.-) [Tessaracoccus bendigoensis DSM 12906]|uniref:Carbohydrate ABC transporter membrane protein 2, CUT1 family (TC 3.A.1.1.-) n=1 Tax=Tessaracoccus bendigoensis DSM 12906 TaxID=1123357 RepID=A0A1M6C2X4_9ACTN|nr:carbohydrate ABC transporter permease [Tessaracoccus bendigoensis]SHI55360.1 carbohydrate ABC transporter membrane protein 2, CUT1 family (TC 3.A.1.1.-) [Tessaracoccus bendigoensis DSM 12906]